MRQQTLYESLHLATFLPRLKLLDLIGINPYVGVSAVIKKPISEHISHPNLRLIRSPKCAKYSFSSDGSWIYELFPFGKLPNLEDFVSEAKHLLTQSHDHWVVHSLVNNVFLG